MGNQGPSREQEGELDFSSDELAEMDVEVAGREDSGGSKRKKRALRVPADEVPRVATVTISTEPELQALVGRDHDAQAADKIVEHAFANGGYAETEVSTPPSFAAGDAPAQAKAPAPALDEDDLEPEVSPEEPERTRKGEVAERIAKLPPNVRALVRAMVPATRTSLDSREMEQLDSDELEVVEREPSGEHPVVPPPSPPMMPASLSSAATAVIPIPDAVPEQEPVDTTEEMSVDEAEELSDPSELDAHDPPPRARKRTLPPAMPAEAAAPSRQRSITPLIIAPDGHNQLIAPAVAPLAPPPPPQLDGAKAGGLRRRKRRTKQWFEEIFDDDYLRTLPYLSPKQTEREAAFISESLQLQPGANLLDVGCGYGRHAMELARKGCQVTGLDLSLPLLIRAADAARRIGVGVNFVHGDMREMSFEGEFDAAYCMFTTFGYFDDDTNRKVAANLARALRPEGKVLLELVNRDYITRDLPTRVWWQGEGCVVLEEVDFNYFSSRLQVQRSIIFEDGRQLEQEISIRAYSLHEIGKVLHHAGFRVTEISGGLGLRGKFFGAHSRQLLVVAEKKSA